MSAPEMMDNTLEGYGMKINTDKTQVLAVGKRGTQIDITLRGQQLNSAE